MFAIYSALYAISTEHYLTVAVVLGYGLARAMLGRIIKLGTGGVGR